MYCQSCGHSVSDQAKFCVNCGKSLEFPEIQKKKKSKIYWVLAIILAVVVWAGANIFVTARIHNYNHLTEVLQYYMGNYCKYCDSVRELNKDNICTMCQYRNKNEDLYNMGKWLFVDSETIEGDISKCKVRGNIKYVKIGSHEVWFIGIYNEDIFNSIEIVKNNGNYIAIKSNDNSYAEGLIRLSNRCKAGYYDDIQSTIKSSAYDLIHDADFRSQSFDGEEFANAFGMLYANGVNPELIP